MDYAADRENSLGSLAEGNQGDVSAGAASGGGKGSGQTASTFIRAAEAERRAGRPGAARRVLARGVEKTVGAERITVLLRWVRLELDASQPTMARTYLDRARRTSGYRETEQTRRLEERLQTLENSGK